MTEAAPPFTPAIRWQLAVVTEIREQTARIKSFFLRLPQPFAFQAGQHVDVRLTAPDGYRAMRSYSIASAPEDAATLELAVERLEDGEVSLFFHETVAVGDQIELRGPLGGYFIWPPTNDGPLFFAGGGSGVVPLMSMVRHRAAAHQSVPVVLLYSARNWDDVLFRDELIAFDGRNDGFTLVVTLTRAAARRPGDFSRRVDAAMIAETLARLPATPRFGYVCGTNAFVNAVADGAVAAGIPAIAIRTERYGG